MINEIQTKVDKIDERIEKLEKWLFDIKNTENSFSVQEALIFSESFDRKEKELKFFQSEKKYLERSISTLIIIKTDIDSLENQLNNKELFNDYDRRISVSNLIMQYKEKKEALENILKLYFKE